MKIDHNLAIIELTDVEADEYQAGIGFYEHVAREARRLANKTGWTVDILRASSCVLIDVVMGE